MEPWKQIAIQEGWDIYDSDGCYDNKDGLCPFQLQVTDDNDNRLCEDDPSAHRHVVAQAIAGSEPHKAALLFLKANSPMEFVTVTGEGLRGAVVRAWLS